MSKDPQLDDHLSLLKRKPGPTIVGQIIANTDDKVSILTPFGIYDVSKPDVTDLVLEPEGSSRVTIARGAKILFCHLIDAESLLARNRASLAHVAQGAKQLQWALNRALGKTEIPVQPAGQTADCPMCDCTDCCQCPVIEDSVEPPSRSGVRMEYYERQIGRAPSESYRNETEKK